MKKNVVFALAAGFVAGAAATIAGTLAGRKIAKEMKEDFTEQVFTSPDGDHKVILTIGSSETAKGLTCVKVNATAAMDDDDCELIIFTRKGDRFLTGEWSENDHFRLLIGNGKHKQCCDVTYDDKNITCNYYLT